MELHELVGFLQQKGFVWGPEPEVYGGLGGFYTYAPLGKLLKNNVEKVMKKTLQEHDFWEVECPTIMQKKVWEASGHLSGFADDVVTCSKCGAQFKVDALLKELYPDEAIDDYKKFFQEKKVSCPNCTHVLEKNIKQLNLMMKTTVGLDIEAYCRPETATTTYLPFIRYYDFFRKNLPFSVFQIGKAYRNEISPRQHMIRMREFTQAEAQMFIFAEQKKKFDVKAIEDVSLTIIPNTGKKEIKTTVKEALHKKYFKNPAYLWNVVLAYKIFKQLQINPDHIRIKQHAKSEMAFYADDAWDIEVKTETLGWIECCGIHDRTNYDLKQHEKFSGKSFEILDDESKKQLPHVLEIAFGVDRLVFSLLDQCYEKKEKGEGKTIMKLPAFLSPITVAVFPLVNKEKLPEIGKNIFDDLSKEFICVYDSSGSIGKRYLREAEKGTAICLTVDFDTMTDNTVTLRERDTEKQIRVNIADVHEKIHAYVAGEKFDLLGRKA
ncbi:glycine--tRNA ligase [Candidatus Woesearchaeota archaeon]|nr:MAG: glycine--tRNA ligase [Candidatus Woesearchaeota archaeon]